MPGVCSRTFAGDFLEFSDEVGATESIVSQSVGRFHPNFFSSNVSRGSLVIITLL